MLVTTHAVVASAVAIKTGNPYLYIPFAVIDHIVLDTLPHFGGDWLKRKENFRLVAVADAICGISLFLIIAFFTHSKFSILILFAVCFLAGWPDIIMLYQKLTGTRKLPRFKKFHRNIQKLEFPAGIFIELAVVLGCLILIFV